jgi:hypothetical protein
MKYIGSTEKKTENVMQNLTIILSEKLQKCWLCHHTFMAIRHLWRATGLPTLSIGP